MAGTKRERLLESAKAGIRTPRPERLEKDKKPAGYRAIGLSLYLPELTWLDRVTEIVRKGGFARANRSFVVQRLIRDNLKELEGKSDQEIARFFKDRVFEQQ